MSFSPNAFSMSSRSRRLVRIGERQRVAGGVVAAGTADAVHVAVDVARHFVVDDEADVFDVEAARGDVGRDEHFVRPARKLR